jgi:predicted  nucleic acid-binding Zn-ribbon protein
MKTVDRFNFRSKHHGTEVVDKTPTGKWVKAADYDAMTAENTRLRQRIQNQTDQINGLERSRRRLESLTAGADRRVEAIEADNARLRDALERVVGEYDLQMYGPAISSIDVARAALSTGKETK